MADINIIQIHELNEATSVAASDMLPIDTGNATLKVKANKFTMGVKGNAESSYRTGMVNLTPANIGAVNKAGDEMTGNLVVHNGGECNVSAYNSDTGTRIYIHAPATGTHGLFSNGYFDGSDFVSDAKWMLFRGTDGNVYLQGNSILQSKTLSITTNASGSAGILTGLYAVIAVKCNTANVYPSFVPFFNANGNTYVQVFDFSKSVPTFLANTTLSVTVYYRPL